jgi:5-methylcytosine-specific restriction endonuclease McrA
LSNLNLFLIFTKKKYMESSIVKLRLKGKTSDEIIAELQCSKSTVNFHLKKHDLDGKLYKILDRLTVDTIRGYSVIFLKEFLSYRQQNMNYNIISGKMNITIVECKKINRLLGFSPNVKDFTNFEEQDIISHYLKIERLKQTAKDFNTTYDTVKKILLKNNIEIIKKVRKTTKSEAVVNWRVEKKKKLVEYKGGECQNCGYKKSIWALEFHHINPSEKDFTIGGSSFSFEKLKAEADKCVLVCANCHVEIHQELKETGKSAIINKIIQLDV